MDDFFVQFKSWRLHRFGVVEGPRFAGIFWVVVLFDSGLVFSSHTSGRVFCGVWCHEQGVLIVERFGPGVSSRGDGHGVD